MAAEVKQKKTYKGEEIAKKKKKKKFGWLFLYQPKESLNACLVLFVCFLLSLSKAKLGFYIIENGTGITHDTLEWE